MTNITKQFPAKPTTNTTEYTATMMGMMGDMGSASASQVPLGGSLNMSDEPGCKVKFWKQSSSCPEGHLSSLKMCTTPLSMVLNSVRTGRAAGKSPRIHLQRVSVRSVYVASVDTLVLIVTMGTDSLRTATRVQGFDRWSEATALFSLRERM
ncbi:hypothetical protein EYF80_010959 [Liparis tanakae]|uniref:Uncharacterized protein n=1 Tax=Liparis tanakae TaxID=230148 RepID=A0A4Z2IL80_9TELE|nr:hypothetical protein EYF80_010959 [Liparis tanakae]